MNKRMQIGCGLRLPVHPAALEVADSGVGELADAVTGQATPQVTPQVSRLLEVLIDDISRAEIMNALALKDRMHFADDYLRPALEEAHKAIHDYSKATVNLSGMAELLMICVKSGTKFNHEYGDIDERFYGSVESFTSV